MLGELMLGIVFDFICEGRVEFVEGVGVVVLAEVWCSESGGEGVGGGFFFADDDDDGDPFFFGVSDFFADAVVAVIDVCSDVNMG